MTPTPVFNAGAPPAAPEGAMPPGTTPLPGDDGAVWADFRQHSRTFSLAARLLPREVQQPVATLYLFCRAVDTVADERPAVIGTDAARRELDGLARDLDGALDGRPRPGDAFWRRFADVHARFRLDPAPLHELIDGARWDLDGRGIDDEGDFLRYCDLVGGTVGAMMLPFLADPGTDSPGARAALDADARALGVAMQITNIVRDVGEDARQRGRSYLPETLLARHGLASGPRATAIPKRPTAAYVAVCESLMDAADARFVRGTDAVSRLSPRVQGAIRAATRCYREILNEVRASGYDNLSRRAVVPLRRKLWLVAADDYADRRRALAAARATPTD